MTSRQKNNETGNLLIQLKNCSVEVGAPKQWELKSTSQEEKTA